MTPPPTASLEKTEKPVDGAFSSSQNPDAKRSTDLMASLGFSSVDLPRIVIIGGGIGGVSVAKALAKHPALKSIVIIEPKKDFEFKPRIYEALNDKRASLPLSEMFPRRGKVKVLHTWAEEIHCDGKERYVSTPDGMVPFDYLIVATGGVTNYFNVEGADAKTLCLNDMQNLEAIRASILTKLSHVEKQLHVGNTSIDSLKSWMAFDIIGAGPTGVELAFEIRHFASHAIQEQFPNIAQAQLSVTIRLIEASGSILPGFSGKERRYTEARLREAQIEILLNHMVKGVTDSALEVAVPTPGSSAMEQFEIPSIEPIWVTGVKANVTDQLLPHCERFPGNNRVKVTPSLELPDYPRIYVIGDAAGAVDPQTGRILPPTGQVTAQQAAFVADDLVLKYFEESKGRKPFHYEDRGRMLSLGPGDAFISMDILPGPLKGTLLKGKMATLIRDTYYDNQLR